MTSEEIVALLGAEERGQRSLFPDADEILLQTSFKSTNRNQPVLVHWWMNVYKPNIYEFGKRISDEVYRSWSNPLYHNFKYVRPSMGYRYCTNQRVVSISVLKNKGFNRALAELKMWAPHIKLGIDERTNSGDDNKRPYKWIDISDNDCSEHGVPDLRIFSENEIHLTYLVYGNFTIKARFTSYEETIRYLQKHHYNTR